MARPPPLGIRRVCTLRLFGSSMRPNRGARWINEAVKTQEMRQGKKKLPKRESHPTISLSPGVQAVVCWRSAVGDRNHEPLAENRPRAASDSRRKSKARVRNFPPGNAE